MGYSVNPTYWPDREEMWHDQSRATAGNVILPQLQVSQTYSMIAVQNFPTAVNDAWSNSVYLEAGTTYIMSILYMKGPASGIMTVSIDGVSVLAALDLYAAGSTYNQISTTSGITVTGTGRHVITGIAASKNASASGYEMGLTKIWFRKTTDTQSHS